MTMTNSAWRRVGFRLDVRKLKGVVFAVAGVLLGASSALAELMILPPDLPGGTEGVAYDSDKEPCLLHLEEEKDVALDVEWWSVAPFKLSREGNSFASLGGTRDWFDKSLASLDENGRLSLDLGFDFPIAGATFSQVNVGAWGPGVWAGGGKGGGPELAVSPGNVAWDFDCTSNPDDGIFIETGLTSDKDPVRFMTIKWVGHAPSKEGNPAPLNFAVTLYADGRVRFTYGACGDPNDKEKSFQAGWVSVFGSNGNDRSADWYFDDYDTPLSATFEDLVFEASSLPPGMELVNVGDGKHARLTGTPMAAGTFPFRVEAMVDMSTSIVQDYTLTVEASAYPKPIQQSVSPSAEDPVVVPINHTQVFSVNVDANGDGPLTYRWLIDGEEVAGETGASFSYTPPAEDAWNCPWIDCVVSSEHWADYISVEWSVEVTNPVCPSGSTTLGATVNVPFEHQLAATGGSGSYTFSLVPYYNVTRSASTYDDSGARTAMTYHGSGIYSLSASDGGVSAFKFLGTEYDQVYVTRHGTIYFDSHYPSYGGFNSSYLMLAPIGTYATDESGTVSYQKFADGVAIFWKGHRSNDGPDAFNVSVRFYNDGKIVLSYGEVVSSNSQNDYPDMTVGYSDGNGNHEVILRNWDSTESLSHVNDFVLTPVLPAGLSLTADGLLSGTFVGEPGEYGFDVLISDSDRSSNATSVHYTLAVSENANAKPVLVSATPEDESVTAYFGHEYEFMAVGSDPEGKPVSYRWEVEGYTPSSYGGHATNESTFVFVPALSSGQRTLKLYLSDDVWSDVLVKTWTLAVGEGPIEIVTDEIIEMTADVYFDGGIAIVGGGGYAYAEWEGDLPRNVTLTTDQGVKIRGTPRDPGDYVFTVRISGNDDSVAEKTFTLRVGGEFTKRNWYVDADNGTWDGDGQSPETAVSSLMYLEDDPISEGDDVYLMGSDAQYVNHGLLDVFEIIHAVPNGNKSIVQVCVQTSAPVEWSERVLVGYGAGMCFNLNEDWSSAKYYCGGLYRVARLPEFWQNKGFDVISSDSHVDGLPIYEDGWVSLRIIGRGGEDRDEYNRGTLELRYPDDDTRKDYELVDWNRASIVDVVNEGDLPQTLSITGTVHIGSYSDAADGETHTIVRNGSVVDLTYGSFGFSWLINGTLTVEPNVRFIVDPTIGGNSRLFRILDGKAGLDLPQGGLTLELTQPMDAQNNDYGWQVIEGYVGNGHEFTLVTADCDSSANYRFEARDGSLWLVRQHDSSGAYSPIKTNPTVVASGYGKQEDYNFFAHISGDSYGVGYRCLMSYYSVSEDTRCTFDGSTGQKIFRYCDGNWNVSPATVELEFRFPLGGVYYDRVQLYGNCALGFDQVMGGSEFQWAILGRINVPDELRDLVAIDSATDHFTVRWGDICSATLTPDGKVRVAYGPLADEYESLEVTRATRFRCLSDPYGYEFETDAVYDRYWDNTYAGANDVVFTPTGRPQEISCRVDVPGFYSYPITRFDGDGSRGPTCNFDVTVEYPPASNRCPELASWSPNCVDFVRMRAGEQRDFWVSSDGSQGVMRQFVWRDGNGEVLKEEVLDMGTSTLQYSPSSAAVAAGRDQVSCTVWSVVRRGAGEDVHYVSVSRSITRTWNVQVGRDFYFDAVNGSDDGDGSQARPYRDFLVPQGSYFSTTQLGDTDRMFLAPGTYRTPIDLQDRVRVEIVGSGATNTIIDLGGNQSGFSQYEDVFDASSGGLIRVPCTNSIVSGVTFANCVDSHYIDPLYGLDEPRVVRGGGAIGGVFKNCVFSNCTAGVRTSGLGQGGAAFGAVLKNCLLTECCATQRGGGASNCELWNCTVVNCRAGETAGGIDGTCRAYNTILWYNTVKGEPSNFDKTRRSEMLTDDIPVLKYCCSDADPFGSEGMLVVEHPHLTWNHRLGSQSPCAQAGSLAYAPDLETDLDGNPRLTVEGAVTSVSIGAFERPESVDTEKVRVYLNIDGDGAFSNLSSPIVGTDPVYGPYVVCPVVGDPLTFEIAGREVLDFYVDGQAQPVPTEFSFPIDRRTELFFVMPGRTYYVDAAAGDDANTGLDWENALATLGEARSRVVGRDAIMLKPGTYDPVDFTGFKGRLTIGTTGSAADTIIDARQSGRCFTADDPTSIVVTGLSFVNGHTEESLNGVGGGVCGGTFVDCVISNCYGYVYGGGAYKATLMRCSVSHNTCDWINEGVITKFGNSGNSWGGGIAVCTADDCLIWANDARGYADDYVHGSGCSASDVRNSFIWGNKVNGVNDPDKSNQYIGNGLVGYSVHNVLHRPAEGERESRPTPVMPGTILPGYYDTEEEAMAAAIGKSVDIPADVANALKLNEFAATQAKYSDYTDMFMFVPYPVKKPVQKTLLKSALIPDAYELRLDLKPDVKAEIIADISKSVQEIPIVTLGKTQMTYQINDTKPGLYYAVEFTGSLGRPFEGKRFMARGGSVDVEVEYTDSAAGFWRIGVYLTPTDR